MGRTRSVFSNFLKSPIAWVSFFCLSVEVVGSSPTSLFGRFSSESSFYLMLALDLKEPFRSFGLPIVLSHFAHISFEHLFLNLIYFILAASFLPHLSRMSFYRLIFGMGVLINLFLIASVRIFFPGVEGYVLGLSSLSLAIASFSAVDSPRKKAWIAVPVVLCLWLMPQESSSVSFLGHSLGIAVGVAAAFIFSFYSQKSAKY